MTVQWLNIRMLFHRTTVFRILALLLVLTACQPLSEFVSAFTPAFTIHVHNVPTRGRAHIMERCVFATADAEEVHKPRNSNNSNNNSNEDDVYSTSSSSSSWTAVEGGFLPRFRPPAKDVPVVREILSLKDYKDIVVQQPDKITVVRFYAPWCRACKAVKAKFYRLSRQYASAAAAAGASSDMKKVQFVEVPLTQETAVLHSGLGVPSLPYGHIYYPQAGLVEERKINKHVFEEFESVLQTYVQGYCNVLYTDDGGTELQP